MKVPGIPNLSAELLECLRKQIKTTHLGVIVHSDENILSIMSNLGAFNVSTETSPRNPQEVIIY